jgi:nucleoside-triphosphatase THEP1
MLTIDSNTIRESHRLGEYWQSNRIVNLLDMIKELDICGLSAAINTINDLKCSVAAIRMATSQMGFKIPIPEVENQKMRDIVSKTLEIIKVGFLDVDLSEFWKTYDLQINRLLKADTVEKMEEILSNLESVLNYVLSAERCFVISRDVHQYLKDDAIHQNIRDYMPECLYDLEEANKGFVFGRNTASVFHCMVALEYVFPKLILLLNASGASIDPNMPLDKNWNQFLNLIDKEIGRLKNISQDPDSKKKLELISEISQRMRWVKGAWRNPVMHARGQFIEEVVIDIMMQTNSFLKFISINSKP